MTSQSALSRGQRQKRWQTDFTEAEWAFIEEKRNGTPRHRFILNLLGYNYEDEHFYAFRVMGLASLLHRTKKQEKIDWDTINSTKTLCGSDITPGYWCITETWAQARSVGKTQNILLLTCRACEKATLL